MHTELLLKNLRKGETTWETEALRLRWEINVKMTLTVICLNVGA
jgi:hypothetical protein